MKPETLRNVDVPFSGFWVILGVKTCDVFLGLAASIILLLFCSLFASLVGFIGYYRY